jgi:predicted nucleic acid-binding protein
MSHDLRFVFDTNVVISAALIKTSIPRQAFDKALEVGSLLLSSSTVAELQEKLRQKRFDKYVTENERLLLLAA